jgi:hypothetical protein
MLRKGDSSARNWLLELGPDRRSHWGRHACAFWRVPGLPSMAYGMADLPPSTPHVCSTWWPCAGHLIDAGRCSASWSEKKEEVAHRRRSAGAQRLRTYLQHMDCQRAALRPAQSAARWQSTGSQDSRSSGPAPARPAPARWPHQPIMARPGRARAAGSWAAIAIQCRCRGALLRLFPVCRQQREASDSAHNRRWAKIDI